MPSTFCPARGLFTTNNRHSFIMEGKRNAWFGEKLRGAFSYLVLVCRDQDPAANIRINGEKIRRSSELAACLPTIVLGPESINLLIGSPVGEGVL